jgi:capsular polysaccharide transport system ATP-binding protein
MTLELRGVTKKIRMGSVRLVYEDLNLRIEERANIALLGRKEAGLDGLVNLICGADAPDKGHIVRTHSISWPIPLTVFMHRHLSLAANARFLARMYEVDEKDYLDRIAANGLDEFLDVRGDQVSTDIRDTFAFVAGMCLRFDRYILTKTSVAKKTDPELAPRLIDDAKKSAGILLISSAAKQAEQFCDQAYVFDQGQATFYDDMEAAAEHFNSIEAKDRDQDMEGEESDDSDSDLENMVALDF